MTKALIDLPRGTVFKFCGMEWILLERTEGGGSLVLSKDIVCEKPFDTDNCNNFADSSIREYLNGEFADSIGARECDFLPYELDLIADDGTTYGKCKTRIGLITADIYRRNRDIIEPIDNWWWTATAYSAAYSCYVRYVYAVGTLLSSNACSGYWGVRPLCNLASGILVQPVEDDGYIGAEKAGEIAKEYMENCPVYITEKQFTYALAAAVSVLGGKNREKEGR